MSLGENGAAWHAITIPVEQKTIVDNLRLNKYKGLCYRRPGRLEWDNVSRSIAGYLQLTRAVSGKAITSSNSHTVPIEGVIRPQMLDILIEISSDSRRRINRINYEIAVLQALRIRLRCKEAWVEGADCYRNPDDDLPELMPRLKAIASQKLYLPFGGERDNYPNLAPILTRPINWELIQQQYDEMVKYATAL